MNDSFIHMYNLHQFNFTKFTQIPLLSGKFQISPFSETFFCLFPLPPSPVDSLCRLFCVLVRPPLLPSPCPGSLGRSSPNVYVVGLNTRVSMSCSLKEIEVARMGTAMLRQLRKAYLAHVVLLHVGAHHLPHLLLLQQLVHGVDVGGHVPA